MKNLEFKIDINAARKKVWETMLDKETYKEWVGVSWPTSYYEGEFKKGKNVRFIGADGSGTLAQIAEYIPFAVCAAKHVAVLNPDGTEDRDSETAKGWIGTTERYMFTETKVVTQLKVEITTQPDWTKMFEDGWPSALKKLKEMCER